MGFLSEDAAVGIEITPGVRKVLDEDDAECSAIRGVDLWLEGCNGAVGCECAPEGVERSNEDRSQWGGPTEFSSYWDEKHLIRSKRKNNRRKRTSYLTSINSLTCPLFP